VTPNLTLRLYAGLTIEGVVNSLYRIEYKTNLEDESWIVAAAISLPQSPYLWIDEQSAAHPRRLYRAVLVP
jgi:hypothetical protein